VDGLGQAGDVVVFAAQEGEQDGGELGVLQNIPQVPAHLADEFRGGVAFRAVVARKMLDKAIELGGDKVKLRALDDPDLLGVWVSGKE